MTCCPTVSLGTSRECQPPVPRVNLSLADLFDGRCSSRARSSFHWFDAVTPPVISRSWTRSRPYSAITLATTAARKNRRAPDLQNHWGAATDLSPD